ncbi:MAG: hypothetical protein K6F32_02625 [Bacilli bacterium]|nr:hypothetical protein [Bacilli bacterium]
MTAFALFSCAGGPEITAEEAQQKVASMKEYIASEKFKMPTKFVLNVQSDPETAASVGDESEFAFHYSYADLYASLFLSTPECSASLYVYADELDVIVASTYADIGAEKETESRSISFEALEAVESGFFNALTAEMASSELFSPYAMSEAEIKNLGLSWQDKLVGPFAIPAPSGRENLYSSWGEGSLQIRSFPEGRDENYPDRLDITNYLFSAYEVRDGSNVTRINVSYGACDTAKPDIA